MAFGLVLAVMLLAGACWALDEGVVQSSTKQPQAAPVRVMASQVFQVTTPLLGRSLSTAELEQLTQFMKQRAESRETVIVVAFPDWFESIAPGELDGPSLVELFHSGKFDPQPPDDVFIYLPGPRLLVGVGGRERLEPFAAKLSHCIEGLDGEFSR